MSTLVLFLVIGLLFLATFLFTFTRGDKDPACVQTSNSGFLLVELTLNTLTMVVISLHTVLFKFAMRRRICLKIRSILNWRSHPLLS